MFSCETVCIAPLISRTPCFLHLASQQCYQPAQVEVSLCCTATRVVFVCVAGWRLRWLSLAMFRTPLTVCRAWFDGRRPTDASCCRVRGLLPVSVAYKTCMHACCLLALLRSLQLLTWIFPTQWSWAHVHFACSCCIACLLAVTGCRGSQGLTIHTEVLC